MRALLLLAVATTVAATTQTARFGRSFQAVFRAAQSSTSRARRDASRCGQALIAVAQCGNVPVAIMSAEDAFDDGDLFTAQEVLAGLCGTPCMDTYIWFYREFEDAGALAVARATR